MKYDFYAGFARADITPMFGIPITGYYKPRYAEGVLDALEINAVAVKKNNNTALLFTIDNCGVGSNVLDVYRKEIAKAAGVDESAVFIHATHTHTGPSLVTPKEAELDIEKEYYHFVLHRFTDAAVTAIKDMKPAAMGIGVGKAEKVAFLRRFLMKDGSIKTNPGVNNPDIVKPIGTVDERVNVIRIDRENAESIVIANFGNHPDTVGGNLISADWPGFTRRKVEKALDNVKCIFFNGAQGDVNHVNVHPAGGDLNDMFMDFDDVSRGYGHARHLGNVMAASVLQVFDKVEYVPVDSIKYMQKQVKIPSNMPDIKDMPQAYKINELHNAGKDDEIPYTGMMLTTVVAEAARMIKLEHGPEFFSLTFSAVSIGGAVFFGIPGEPFTPIGMKLKEAKDWKMVLPCCLTNSSDGYFPMQDSYDEGGYEARSSRFKAGVAELIIDNGIEILGELYSKKN